MAYLGFTPRYYVGIILLVAASVCYGLFFRKIRLGRKAVSADITLWVLTFSFGLLLTQQQKVFRESKLKSAGLAGVYKIRVLDFPRQKNNRILCRVRVEGRWSGKNHLKQVGESAMIFFDSGIILPAPGQSILVACTFQEIRKRSGPVVFDNKRYLRNKGIRYSGAVQNERQVRILKSKHLAFNESVLRAGVRHLNTIIRKNVKGEEDAAVVESLLFGYREDLPDDLVRTYSKTGTVHVLAVSGMHVALVFLLLEKLLWFLKRFKYGMYIKAILSVAAIWYYCILSGMEASILRAGWMISLVIIGRTIHRRYPVMNLVAASAFILLLINPLWIEDIGFQLSFAAVTGIVTLQGIIMPWFKPRKIFFREIWNLTVASICAQVATFPLILYHFNQFPNYFLPANLVIVPLTTLIIYTGVLMLACMKIPLLLDFFSRAIEKLVFLTNESARAIESLPGSVSDGILLLLPQFLLLYAGLILFLSAVKSGNKNLLVVSFVSFFLVFAIRQIHQWTLKKQSEITFFSLNRQNYILFSGRNKNILLTDSLPDESQLERIKPWLIRNRRFPLDQIIRLNNHEEIKDVSMGFVFRNNKAWFRKIHLDFGETTCFRRDKHYHFIFPDKLDNLNLYAYQRGYSCRHFILGNGRLSRKLTKVRSILSKNQGIVKIDLTGNNIFILKISESK